MQHLEIIKAQRAGDHTELGIGYSETLIIVAEYCEWSTEKQPVSMQNVRLYIASASCGALHVQPPPIKTDTSCPHQEVDRLADELELLPRGAGEVGARLVDPHLELLKTRLHILPVAKGAALAPQEEAASRGRRTGHGKSN